MHFNYKFGFIAYRMKKLKIIQRVIKTPEVFPVHNPRIYPGDKTEDKFTTPAGLPVCYRETPTEFSSQTYSHTPG